MEFLKQNWLRLIILFIGIVIFFYFGRYLQVNENLYNRMLKIRTEGHYSGVVCEKYIDSSEHSTPKLRLTDTLISLENTFWDKISVGDSIVKIKKETFITLYRKNNEKIIFDYNEYFENLKEKSDKK